MSALAGYTPGQQTPLTAADNPNSVIVDNLDDATKVKYITALIGPRDLAKTTPEIAIQNTLNGQFGTGGCHEQAQKQHLTQTEFQTDFADKLVALQDSIATDPRILELEQTITQCVTQQGQTYTPPNQAYSLWATELGLINQYIDPSNPDQQLPAEALTKLTALQTAEIELATATHTCDGTPEQQKDTYQEVTNDHENDFINTHKARLNNYKTDN